MDNLNMVDCCHLLVIDCYKIKLLPETTSDVAYCAYNVQSDTASGVLGSEETVGLGQTSFILSIKCSVWSNALKYTYLPA